ncbi:protein phosphatase 1 regulatory subunit 12A isoform X2 [Lates japonicus]|uniref:Protein phosphatase 1 regulatory subunit 12A isoform X2 n=1 Tax=Lates japonicus TaxID=270547 RepID=A0AAD3M7D6_LATJO|nr:protein phosphatase 1 regulatory subunit 12A isoform X2 [Lates japonicus]
MRLTLTYLSCLASQPANTPAIIPSALGGGRQPVRRASQVLNHLQLGPNTCNTKPWQPPASHYQSYSISQRLFRRRHGPWVPRRIFITTTTTSSSVTSPLSRQRPALSLGLFALAPPVSPAGHDTSARQSSPRGLRSRQAVIEEVPLRYLAPFSRGGCWHHKPCGRGRAWQSSALTLLGIGKAGSGPLDRLRRLQAGDGLASVVAKLYLIRLQPAARMNSHVRLSTCIFSSSLPFFSPSPSLFFSYSVSALPAPIDRRVPSR